MDIVFILKGTGFFICLVYWQMNHKPIIPPDLLERDWTLSYKQSDGIVKYERYFYNTHAQKRLSALVEKDFNTTAAIDLTKYKRKTEEKIRYTWQH